MSKETIKVYVAGTHAGKRYNPGPDGIELEVSPSQAKALRDRGADKPRTSEASAPDTESPAAPVIPAGAGVGAGSGTPEVPADKTPVASRPRGS